MDEKLSLRDQLFNKQKVEKIAREIKGVYPEFNGTNFVKQTVVKFPQLGLVERSLWIAENLKKYLPEDYQKAVTILRQSLPEKLPADFGDFIYAPYSDFIAKYGCTKKDLVFSLNALKEFTIYFSAEGAIRFFINAYPEESFAEILKWSKDKDYRVRRLASEGTRPLLPWCIRITTKPEMPIPILDNLFFDKERFVTRSVANHLNDISKINPTLVLQTLKRWQNSKKQTEKEMEYIIYQSLRTLIKRGSQDAITFLKFSKNPKVTIANFIVKPTTVRIGESLEFSFVLTARKDEKLLIDYIIYFNNKAGSGHNKKVFKLKIVTLNKSQTISITKKQRMQHFSTRKLYPGKHKIEIQINGKKAAETPFEVKT